VIGVINVIICDDKRTMVETKAGSRQAGPCARKLVSWSEPRGAGEDHWAQQRDSGGEGWAGGTQSHI
jgi:hypothetical protein